MTIAPKVSIVIPIYNDAAYLRQALKSAAGQSLEDIEIICVDDASTDESRKVVEEIAAGDARIKLVVHAENLGASQARRDGVSASSGEYVMFLDGDDKLVPHACESAYAAIVAADTDMLQFGIEVVNCANVSQERIDRNQRAFDPCLERIDAEDGLGLVPPCFERHRISFNLVNKIYRGDICRETFGLVEAKRFNCGEDLYTFFILAACMRSYAGIKDRLYQYQFGRGRTGGSNMSFGSFIELLTERDVVEALRHFASTRECSKRLGTIIDGIERHFLGECISKWRTDLAASERAAGFERLVDTWGYEDVVCSLAATNWTDRAKTASDLRYVTRLRHKKRPMGKRLTVAYYYRCIANGGAQRVAAELCNIWAAARGVDGVSCYRVVLICDGGPEENEYPLSPEVARRYVPPREESQRGDYRARFEAWQRLLDEEQVDVVVYGQWVDSCALWDLLAIKGHSSRPAFLLHDHSFTALPYRWEGDVAATLADLYRLCDGVAVLSECDRALVGTFCSNVRYIVNPLGYLAQNRRESAPERHAIVWTGRISAEKRPLDLVRMMPAVLERVPDARLYIVGAGDEQLTRQLEEEIVRLGLQDNATLEGFTLDVAAWYQRAKVFVCTSDYEGFSLTIGEALSFETPVVMYDLPWLTFARDGRGIVSVEQGRWDLLAAEVARLLEHPDEACALGRAGREHIDELLAVDLAAEWGALLDGIDPDAVPIVTDERILFRFLTEYQEQAKSAMRQKRSSDSKRIVELGRRAGLDSFTTARIDLRNFGFDGNDVQVIKVSDPRAAVKKAGWSGGDGKIIESREGSLSIELCCIGAGTLEVTLRGVDVRGEDGRRVPLWVDFASLEINGVGQLEESVAVWHDRPYKLRVPVADGDVIVVAAAWRPHVEAERDAALARSERLEGELTSAREELATARRELAVREVEVAVLRAEVAQSKAMNARLQAESERTRVEMARECAMAVEA